MNEVNEGLEYAQMLEIPVSTVSVVKKRSLFGRRGRKGDDLKDSVIGSVNSRLGESAVRTQTEVAEGYGEQFYSGVDLSGQNGEEQTATPKAKKKSGAAGKVIMAEAVAACLIAAGIFVTNIFMPNTVINAFMGSLSAIKETEAAYSDFKLTPVVSELSEAEVSVNGEGVLCFTGSTGVYPVCDGKIAAISKTDDLYTVKIAHTSDFCSVFTGLSAIYCEVGDSVKSNIPFARSDGKNEVKVSMYDGENVLSCYSLSGVLPVWNS